MDNDLEWRPMLDFKRSLHTGGNSVLQDVHVVSYQLVQALSKTVIRQKNYKKNGFLPLKLLSQQCSPEEQRCKLTDTYGLSEVHYKLAFQLICIDYFSNTSVSTQFTKLNIMSTVIRQEK